MWTSRSFHPLAMLLADAHNIGLLFETESEYQQNATDLCHASTLGSTNTALCDCCAASGALSRYVYYSHVERVALRGWSGDLLCSYLETGILGEGIPTLRSASLALAFVLLGGFCYPRSGVLLSPYKYLL